MELEIIPGSFSSSMFDINHNMIPTTTTYYVIVNNRTVNKIHMIAFEVKISSTVIDLYKLNLKSNLICIRLRKTAIDSNMINRNRLNRAKLVVKYGCAR